MHREDDQMPTRVGLVGVGLMGAVFAKHFLARGLEVIGYDIDSQRLDWLRQMGGRSAANVRAAENCRSDRSSRHERFRCAVGFGGGTCPGSSEGRRPGGRSLRS